MIPRIRRKDLRTGAFATIICLAAVLFSAGCQTNPVTGRSELRLVSESQEVQLGHRTHPNVIFMYDGEYYDHELNRYLGTIVMRLHSVSHRAQMPMDFTMLNTSTINAFATPAHVYATRGFLAELENEAQFAAVMGHELAHVAAGHSAQRLSQNILISLAFGLAGQVADSGAASAALNVGQVGVTLLGLSYSREQERQADRVGTYYMALAGWDPDEAISMQRLLHDLNEHQANFMDKYLSTHPQEENRISEIRAVVDERNLSRRHVQGDGVFADRWNRRLQRLRQVNQDFAPYDRGMKLLEKKDYRAALQAAEEALSIRDDQAQFFRLKGDALLGLNRIRESRDAYGQSLDRDGRYVLANLGLAQAYEAEGNHRAAEREYAKVAHDYPGSVQGLYGLAVSRYRLQDYAGAVRPFEEVVNAVPELAPAHYMLANCYERTGRPAAAYQSYHSALSAGLSGTERNSAANRIRALQPVVAPESEEK